MQFVSEDDIGEVLYRAVIADVTGIFNVAGDGVVRFSDVVRAIGKRPLAIPAGLLYPTTALLWRLRLAPFPAGIVDMIRYPWVADISRLKTDFGYTPRLTSREALAEFAAAQGFVRGRPRGAPAGRP
jgi:UDP-glucose 4-epimerase